MSLNFLDIGMWAGTASPSPLPKECQYVLYTPGAPIQGHSCRSLLSCISPMTASVCVCEIFHPFHALHCVFIKQVQGQRNGKTVADCNL